MRPAIYLSVMACLAVSFGAAAETRLTVMSFNVRYGTANDGENHWDHRKDILVDAIREFSPDVIGTQETLDFQADYIVEKLPEFEWLGVGREADGTGEMMAVLYNKNVLALEDSGHYWLSETPEVPGSKSWDTACTRLVTWCRFKHNETGHKFYFANSHFDHVSDPARINAAKLMNSRLPEDEQTVIVAGDFNAIAENSATWDTFIESGYTDAWLAAAETVGPTVTFSRFGPPPADRQDRRIDWILFKGDVTVDRMETSVFNRDGRYPSDHYPVVAHMRVR